MKTAFLLRTGGNGSDKAIPILRETLTLGRSASSDVVLEDESVSRHHASIHGIGEVELRFILKTISDCGGNLKETASRLRISRSTLYEKLKRFNIRPDDLRRG